MEPLLNLALIFLARNQKAACRGCEFAHKKRLLMQKSLVQAQNALVAKELRGRERCLNF
jgi:hypothetical protein